MMRLSRNCDDMLKELDMENTRLGGKLHQLPSGAVASGEGTAEEASVVEREARVHLDDVVFVEYEVLRQRGAADVVVYSLRAAIDGHSRASIQKQPREAEWVFEA
nr:hypothetical protein Iba_chr14aCG8970 [Ipomoea batatas]GME12510.1 hypothetical protein Iba_scaffold13898CG0020 [Ipomoea batatas]GME12513.1 hypothetical protein Iba_scaffold13899CG0020 [Ipomoea batatas]